ncbi:MAG TPA: polyketide synthase [Cyanobacteria bacterium UBA12227]|nr:polyketide synthase [Cyanobacteria bacterium UBA12227]HAX85449.1 polyketide synthase [Cyanobacteria bacterium UBA11370]HBY76632.1 polyketide synthase [Cyanobacteria bacterium UBA11148]
MQLQNSSSKLDDATIQSDLETNGKSVDSVQALETWMVNQLCEQLSLDAKTIDVKEPLTRYGLDSIDAVTIVGELEDWLELELPSTLFWDYPTIEKSAQYLVEEFDIASALNKAEPAAKTETQKPTTEKSSKGGWGGFWGKK